jgi:hypothetical protein
MPLRPDDGYPARSEGARTAPERGPESLDFSDHDRDEGIVGIAFGAVSRALNDA